MDINVCTDLRTPTGDQCSSGLDLLLLSCFANGQSHSYEHSWLWF